MKTEFYKEKIRTDTELLKLFFSAELVLLGLFATLLMKDNLGENQTHGYLLVILVMVITLNGYTCYSFYIKINDTLSKLENGNNNI